MKYRLTPFHGLALLTSYWMVTWIIEVSKIKGDPGLGGLGPFVFFGMTVVVLTLDYIIQAVIKNRKWVIIVELVLIAIAAIYYYFEVP